MKKAVILIFLSLLFGIIGGAIGASIMLQYRMPTQIDKLKGFYEVENAVYVSPLFLLEALKKGENPYLLVDLRSEKEFAREHIEDAVNIPAALEEEEIIGSFKKLPKEKDIVIYCERLPCMNAINIGKLLAEQHIFVRQLGSGWNDWKMYRAELNG